MASTDKPQDVREDVTDATPSGNDVTPFSGGNQHVPVSSKSASDLSSAGDSGFSSLSLVQDDEKIVSYKMNHKRRGKIVVICNSKFQPHLHLGDRSGHEKDITALRETFADALGFEWHFLENQTAQEMYLAMLKESGEDHKDCDCFMVVFLTHGESMGKIFGIDGGITIDKLVEPLKNCESLGGKPKLVIIQACRGKNLDRGVRISHDGGESGSTSSESIITLPAEADFLYAYSTADGFVAFNNPKSGSWFIQALCAEFKLSSKTLEVMQMLTRVCHKIAYEHSSYTPSRPGTHNLKQVSSVTTTLTKALRF